MSVEHAWAAGFLDGEGNFYVHRRRSTSYEMGVQVGQVDRRPLERLQALYGGSIAPRSGRGIRSDYFAWRAHGATAMRAMIPSVAPFLVVKREQAERVLAVAELTPLRGVKLSSAQAARRDRAALT
jgi:hypothetical protein